jgi:aldehyde dehydrogenase (NAD+)
MNAGQICLTTNHVFVDPKIHDEFVARMGFWFDKFLGGKTDDFCRIVNDRNYERLMKQLNGTDGTVTYSGKNIKEEKLIWPTVVVDIKMSGMCD